MGVLFLLFLFVVFVWFVLILHSWLRAARGDNSKTRHSNFTVDVGDSAGVKSIQGSRPYQEDAYQVQINNDSAYYGVYDGHGGQRASAFTAENLHKLVLHHLALEETNHARAHGRKASGANSEAEDPHGCRSGGCDVWHDHAHTALTSAFLQLDLEWLELANRHGYDDGTTAVGVLFQHKTMYVANVGDSRAVLCHKGQAQDMSHDHKPIREDEKQRIESLGGRIIHYGTWRVEGVLAVTRAVGDRRLKKYVSAEPEIKRRKLQSGDDYLILASDGVWDVLSSQAAVDIVCASENVQEASQRLTDTAYKRGSMDNITSLVIDLRKYRM